MRGAIMRVPYLFAVLLMLSSCQNPSRIQAEHFSEAAPNPPRTAG